MQNNSSSINDEELNQMIANLQKNQRGGVNSSAPTPVRPANEAVIQPPKKEKMIKAAPSEAANDKPADQVPVATEMPLPTVDNNLADSAKLTTAGGDLQEIKREAVTELRPLVDKLDLAPADKFDVLLLLIRTTNDSSLIAKAHETARQIPDENRRAQALLSIIQEVDYFSQKK